MVSEKAPPAQAAVGAGRAAMYVFGGALFLSATLLFAVQPMFAKMVLPRLGGAPGVWSVALVFFQGMLLAGYAYAHFLIRNAGPRAGAFIHMAVMAVGVLFLPLALASGWGHPPDDGQVLYLLGLFTVSIGLPFFALSANAPLLQAWYARSGAPGGDDPYFLYGASNLGSFIALLGYPFVIEPALRLTEQSIWWSLGYGALLLWITGLGLYANKGAVTVRAVPAQSPRIPSRRRLSWLFFAFVPTALLVAVTAHISTDVAAAPFLWVIPLAIFLLTFVLVFRERPLVPYYLLAALLPALIIFVAADWLVRGILPMTGLIALHIVTFFVAAMVAHSRLYALRPASDRLTEFYLWMSLGGVLGGAFTGLVAPNIFPTILEYPILLVLALLALVKPERIEEGEWKAAAVVFAVAALAAIFIFMSDRALPLDYADHFKIGIVAALGVALFFARPAPLFAVSLLAAGLLVGGAIAPRSNTVELVRSFFGVHKVQDFRSGVFRVLYHGTTLHGAQQLENGNPRPGWPEPLTYYHTQSPMVEVIRAAREAGKSVRLSPVGIVGLGAGSLACYRQEGETWHFYEIDVDVVHLARDSGLFKFLPACAPEAPIHIGDARITLAETDRKHELLLIDAFSSDAIPTHLLTREAIEMYFERLTPDGVLVLHISNRHLDLHTEVARLARDLGLSAWSKREESKPDYGARLVATSEVVALARSDEAFGALPSLEGWTKVEPEQGPAWTDDYSDILSAFLRHLNQP